MADHVEKFIKEFEAAIVRRRRHHKISSAVRAATREAGQLATHLDQLAELGQAQSWISADDLRSMKAEMSPLKKPPSLESLVSNAHALIQVVEDGIVEGDAGRLKELVSEAKTLSNKPKASKRYRTKPLASPARVRCVDCDTVVVGVRKPYLNWDSIRDGIRSHEQGTHGAVPESLTRELSQCIQPLRTGTSFVSAGRYEISTAAKD